MDINEKINIRTHLNSRWGSTTVSGIFYLYDVQKRSSPIIDKNSKIYQLVKKIASEPYRGQDHAWYQVKSLDKSNEIKPQFTIGNWYKLEDGSVINYQGVSSKIKCSKGYGRLGEKGNWFNSNNWRLQNATEATEKEISEAIEDQARQRYGFRWKIVRIKKHADENEKNKINTGNYKVVVCRSSPSSGYELWNKNGILFSNGNWAEVLEWPKVLIKDKWYKKLGTKSENRKGQIFIVKFSGNYGAECNIGFDYTGLFNNNICIPKDYYLEGYIEMTDKEILKKLCDYGLKQGWSKETIAKFVNDNI